METCLVVKDEVLADPGDQLGHALIPLQVDVLVFKRAPEPLDKNVVQAAPAAIHADADAGLIKPGGEIDTGELGALVGVEDLRPAVAQGRLQSLQAEGRVQGVGDGPGEYVSAEPVHHRHQVDEAAAQRQIGDVAGPNLVRALDRHPAQQVGIDAVLVAR